MSVGRNRNKERGKGGGVIAKGKDVIETRNYWAHCEKDLAVCSEQGEGQGEGEGEGEGEGQGEGKEKGKGRGRGSQREGKYVFTTADPKSPYISAYLLSFSKIRKTF